MTEIPVKPFPHGKPFAKDGEPKSVSALLRRARMILAPRGAWYLGGYKGAGNSRCTVQALRDSDGKLVNQATGIVLSAIRELPNNHTVSSIQTWNDNPKRKKYEVLAVLDRAIEIAEKEGK